MTTENDSLLSSKYNCYSLGNDQFIGFKGRPKYLYITNIANAKIQIMQIILYQIFILKGR